MRIAVVDVAAEDRGALSVLNDFVDKLMDCAKEGDDEWYIMTSVIDIKESTHVHNFKFPTVKKSWFHRLWWEYTVFRRLIKELKIDVVFSLQNNGLPVKQVKQIVYVHNVLLVQNKIRFSWLDPSERNVAIYCNVLAPYVRYSWKYVDYIIVQGNSVKEQVKKYFPPKNIYVCRPNMGLKEENIIQSGEIKGFIYPTTVRSYKNFELIINAVKKLEKEKKNVEIFITIRGDESPYAKEIKRKALETKGIHLIGSQERQYILQSYKELGLLLVSKLESFSVPILEAMTCQTVIVALDMPYVKDHLDATNYNRLYISKENADDLASVLYKAKQDRQKGNYIYPSEKSEIEKIIQIIKTRKK